LFNKLGRAIPRLERFSRRALINTISKINISIIIANIAKRYGTFMFISIPSISLWAVGEVLRIYTLYIQNPDKMNNLFKQNSIRQDIKITKKRFVLHPFRITLYNLLLLRWLLRSSFWSAGTFFATRPCPYWRIPSQ